VAVCVPEFDELQRALRGEPTNGTYIVQKYVVSSLRTRGHRLTFFGRHGLGTDVCTPDPDDPRPARLTWSDTPLFHVARKASWKAQQVLGVPYLSFFDNLRLFDGALHAFGGHDIVYERSALYRAGIARAARRLGLPYVLFVEADEILEHDYMGDPIRGLLRWRAGRMFRYNLRAADLVVSVTAQLRDHLVARWGVPPAKAVVLPNGVDTDRFKPDSDARAAARQALGVGDAPVVLFVGNFYEWHDVGTLLDAFAEVRPRRPDARLLLVGDGATRTAMEERARALLLDDAVRFTGLLPHDDVPRLMAAADIAVAPYPPLKHDLWLSPLKLYEYLASGLPVVASSVGQMLDVIEPERNGLLASPGDAADLGRALERLLADADLRVRLGRQARADAVELHSWDRYGARLESLFGAARHGRASASR
jgi:glycosyltransferase involved in cell wall biosynthesis